MKLFHKSYGQKGPHLFFLHGWGFNSAVWECLIPVLEKNYRVTLVDLPGHGQSDFNRSCKDILYQSQAVSELITEPTHLIGWSLGGLIALHIIYFFPDKIKSFMGICTSPKFLATELWPGISPDLLNNFSQDLKKQYEKTLSRFLLLQWPKPEEKRQLISQVKNSVYKQGKPSMDALELGLAHLKKIDCRDYVASLKTPSTFLLGTLDTLVPKKILSPLAALNPDCHVISIPHAGHAPFLSHPDIFLHQLTKHIEGHIYA